MKLIIRTQYRENYGAHDWDGKGVCPQYWKSKGGETYVLDVTLDQALDSEFYDAVARCIDFSNEYASETVYTETLLDEVDFDATNVVEEWDTYISALYDNGVLVCKRDVKRYDDDAVVGQRSWIQDQNGKREMQLERFEEAA